MAGGNGFGSAPNQLFNPQYAFVDAKGNLYVLEVFNEGVQKFRRDQQPHPMESLLQGGIARGLQEISIGKVV